MPTLTQLFPLPGYESSSVADINDAGRCVGTSFDPSQPSWGPASRATLWSGQTVTQLQPPDPSLIQPQVAMRIDKSGRVLCRIERSGDEASYYLWLSETEPAIDLGNVIGDLKDAIDLNDHGVLLFTLKSGGLAFQDMDGGPRTLLPPYPFTNTAEFHPPLPVGLDNAGRVVVCWPQKAFFVPTYLTRYWMPSAPNQWHELPESHFWFPPFLAETGHALVTGSDNFNAGRAYYYDMDGKPPHGVQIPHGGQSTSNLLFSVYTDANNFGWFVGGEGETGTYTPTLYRQPENTLSFLENDYPFPQWHPSYCTGIAGQTIVGEGHSGPGGRPRAWRLDLGNRDPMPHPFQRAHRTLPFAIDPKAALLGVTSSWYILLTKPDPAPFDILRQLVNDLTPEERGKVLGQVQEIDTRFKALAKMLRDAGVKG